VSNPIHEGASIMTQREMQPNDPAQDLLERALTALERDPSAMITLSDADLAGIVGVVYLQAMRTALAVRGAAPSQLKWYVDYPARYDEAFCANPRKAVSSSYSPPASSQSLASFVRIGQVDIAALDQW
jgi:hypothetical protein